LIVNQGNQSQSLHAAANASQSYCGRDQATPVNFSDIVNDPNRGYIENLYRRCIVDGRTADKFVPEDTITRAEFLKIVLNIFNLGSSQYMDSFSDVRADDWASKYVARALELKLIGLADKFEPNRPVSRAEALKIVLLAKKVPDLEGYHAHYLDSSTDDWFYHYAAYAHAHNLFGVTPVN
jgi:hypothetical protein